MRFAEVGSIIKNTTGFTWVLVKLTKEKVAFICIDTGNKDNKNLSVHKEGYIHLTKNKQGNTEKYFINNPEFNVVGKVENIKNLLVLYGDKNVQIK